MSSKFILKFLSLIVFGLSFGTALVFVADRHTETENSLATLQYYRRHVASVGPITKMGVDEIAWTYLKISMSNKYLAQNNNENSIVEVTIEALKDIPNSLNYNWLLSSQVTSDDTLIGQLAAMNEGDKVTLELKVSNYSSASASNVGFQILGQIGNHKLQRSTIISSRPEDSFEYIVEQKENKIYNEALDETRSPSGKVNVMKLQNRANKFRLDKIVK